MLLTKVEVLRHTSAARMKEKDIVIVNGSGLVLVKGDLTISINI
jgi:hypothetical protein